MQLITQTSNNWGYSDIPGGCHKRLEDPPAWLKVATTLEKPPTPTHRYFMRWFCYSLIISYTCLICKSGNQINYSNEGLQMWHIAIRLCCWRWYIQDTLGQYHASLDSLSCRDINRRVKRIHCYLNNLQSLVSRRWMVLQEFIDDISTMVEAMATSHYMSQIWPRTLSLYGVTRPHSVE